MVFSTYTTEPFFIFFFVFDFVFDVIVVAVLPAVHVSSKSIKFRLDCCRLCTTMKPPLFFRTRTHACHLLKTEPAVCAVRLLTVTTAHYGRHHFSAQRLLNECFGMGPSDVSSQVEVTAMTSPCEFTSMSWELILPASAGIMTVDQVCHYIEDARNIGFHGWSSAGAALVKVRCDLGYRVH